MAAQVKTAAKFFKKYPAIEIIIFSVVIILLVWLVARGSERLGYHWQWYRIPQYIIHVKDGTLTIGPLLEGLIVTLHITGVSLILAFACGLTAAIFRLSHSFLARAVARIYLETIRNTPLLVQIFFVYFVLSPILGINRFASAVMALSLFEGAYASEIIRAGIISVHTGQWEAGRSLGMDHFQTYFYIVLPQAVRRILPPLTGQAVSLVKDSALVSTIAIYDLTMQGQAIIAETYLTFEMWFTIAAIYLALALTLSRVVAYFEKRYRVVS